MNENQSTESAVPSYSSAEAVSRRAYELWENEGRPEGCDLRHWLQAEQELGASQSGGDRSAEISPARSADSGNDVQPLQGTRAASAANREPRRGSASPFKEFRFRG
jgi:hypothetical protein